MLTKRFGGRSLPEGTESCCTESHVQRYHLLSNSDPSEGTENSYTEWQAQGYRLLSNSDPLEGTESKNNVHLC
jgi:hypothetical protein